ncbi:hypothetical protein CALCODRAFT_153912 [Calocera cornea HHB12733]|uniref:F-box domain-containing protein n=1 Tax=Calocera cornea HHB12733 TaxID=1353952 RepID=A0A165CM41_9BASI|nr:hypothetical protein CALCODRAFT_153912 [Calocera cornea HHB12733]
MPLSPPQLGTIVFHPISNPTGHSASSCRLSCLSRMTLPNERVCCTSVLAWKPPSERSTIRCRSWDPSVGLSSPNRTDSMKKIKVCEDEVAIILEQQDDVFMQIATCSVYLARVVNELEVLGIYRLPIQDFPSDILRLILLEASAVDRTFRWVAMGVCTKWRDILQSTPSLWSHVQVTFTLHDSDDLHITRRALHFGGQYPLHSMFQPPSNLTLTQHIHLRVKRRTGEQESSTLPTARSIPQPMACRVLKL